MVAKGRGRLVALAFALLVPRGAHAEAEMFRFSWVRGDGAGSCPDGRSLAARVAERLGRNPFSDTAVESIEGSVVRVGDRFHAALHVRDAAGVARGTRELSALGTDCGELADAVVLAVVLTIDPNAALEGKPAPPPATVTPPSPVAPPVSGPPPLDACPVVRCPPPRPCPEASCPPLPLFANGALALRGLLAVGVLPEVAPGAGAFGELGTQRVRAALGMRYFPESSTGGGSYAFGLTAGTLGALYAWPVADGFEVSLIGELELGAIHAVVHEIEPVEPGDRPWVAAAAGPRLLVTALSPLRVELGGSLVVPFVRPIFEVRGLAEPVFQTSPVAGFGYLGVGLGTP